MEIKRYEQKTTNMKIRRYEEKNNKLNVSKEEVNEWYDLLILFLSSYNKRIIEERNG